MATRSLADEVAGPQGPGSTRFEVHVTNTNNIVSNQIKLN